MPFLYSRNVIIHDTTNDCDARVTSARADTHPAPGAVTNRPIIRQRNSAPVHAGRAMTA